MATLGEEAEFERIALAMGLIDADAVVAWADSKIAEMSDPPIQLIGVSTAGSSDKVEMMDLLKAIPGPGDPSVAAHRVIALFGERFRSGGIELDPACEMLRAYSGWAIVSADEQSQARNFDEYLYGVQSGSFCTVEALHQLILEFADEYGE